jgi:hypothetical protein
LPRRRARAAEAVDRRREADLAAELARLLLGGGALHDALAVAACCARTSRTCARRWKAPPAMARAA